MNDIVKGLIKTALDSVEALENRITDVKYGPLELESCETILFKLDGKQYIGDLVGRNRNLILTSKREHDAAIACRVLLDGNATEV